MPLRVLMVTTTYPPHVSGVARSVEMTALELRLRNVRCIVLAPEAGVNVTDQFNDHFVVRVPAVAFGENFATFRTRPTVRQVIAKLTPHVIHSHHPFLIGDSVLFRGRPLVFTWHTTHENRLQNPTVRHWMRSKAVQYANHCAFVIAPSRDTAKQLRTLGVTSPIGVLPTGIDDTTFCIRGRKPAGPPYTVGFVGRLAAEKNLEGLARGLSKLAPGHFRCVVVGDGPEREPFLRRLRERLETKYAGVLQGAALAAAYRGMDVFAFASKVETQGMVVAEAALCGTPVVALDASGVRDVVTPEVGRLVPDEDSLAAAITQVCAERRDPRFVSLGAQGFALSNTVPRLMQLYARL